MIQTEFHAVQLRFYWDCAQQRIARLTRSGSWIMGSGEQADWRLPDPGVSAVHCRFIVDQEGRSTVQDLNSRNGTRLNGRLIRHPNRLNSGDLLQLGYITLLFFAEEEFREFQ